MLVFASAPLGGAKQSYSSSSVSPKKSNMAAPPKGRVVKFILRFLNMLSNLCYAAFPVENTDVNEFSWTLQLCLEGLDALSIIWDTPSCGSCHR